MRPLAASKRSSPGRNVRTKPTSSSIVRDGKALFVKIVNKANAAFAKLDGTHGLIKYGHLNFLALGPATKTMFWRGSV